MEETSDLVQQYKEVISRRLPLSMIVAAVLILLTTILALGLPSYYKSRAVILIEAQEMPQDLVRSLVTSFADQRIQVISQRVLTNANLGTIIEKFDLYRDERKKDPLETVLAKMRRDIAITPISADVADPKNGRSMQTTIAFELAYDNKSPSVAQRVASELVSLFLSENLRQRSETSKETLSFLSSESTRLGSEVAGYEQKLADFKEKNVEQLPELANLNLELVNRTENDVRTLDSQIRSLEQQKVYLESELAQQKPNLGVFAETGERILGPADRLKVLESEFAPLAARYGAAHPDVVSKRKEIEALRSQVGGSSESNGLAVKLGVAQSELDSARKKYSPEHPDVKRLERAVVSLEDAIRSAQGQSTGQSAASVRPDNPAYIQLQARLEGTLSDLSSLKGQRESLNARLRELDSRIAKSPEVERQYRALTRDYETAQQKYREIQAKRQEAELASNLESEQKGERFTLIEPPTVPEEPSKPNRLAIALVGLFFSVGAAGGSGLVAESVDDRIYGRLGVLRSIGVPPLAVIPSFETAESRRRRLRTVVIVVAILLVILSMVAIAIHFLYSPLDVLFFRGLRALGL